MKIKLIVSSLMASIAAFVVPAAAFAQVSGTYVQGRVYDPSNGNAQVAGANVQVTCNGNTLTAVTDGTGLYKVTYDVSVCNDGDSLQVVADKGSMHGSNTGTVGNVTTNINVGVVNIFVSQVPEFGLVTGAMALLTSGGSLFAFRRMRKV